MNYLNLLVASEHLHTHTHTHNVVTVLKKRCWVNCYKYSLIENSVTWKSRSISVYNENCYHEW